MKFIKFIVLLFFLSFISCDHSTNVQEDFSEEISFKVSNHILTEYNITSIVFDKNSVAWIGTFKQGLIKYDGTVKIFSSENSILSHDLVIQDIVADHNNIIWCATNIGLLKYNHEKFELFNTTNSPMLEDIAWDLQIDNSNNLWICSCRFRQGGLMKLSNDIWTTYTPENSSLPGNLITKLALDLEGNIWGGVDFSSVIKLSDDKWVLFDQKEIGFKPWNFLSITCSDNSVFISLDNSLSSSAIHSDLPKIIRFSSNKWNDITPFKGSENLKGNVGKLVLDKRGYIWTSFVTNDDKYLMVYDDSEWEYELVNIPISYFFSPLAVDDNNTIWIGTHEGIYLIEQ